MLRETAFRAPTFLLVLSLITACEESTVDLNNGGVKGGLSNPPTTSVYATQIGISGLNNPVEDTCNAYTFTARDQNQITAPVQSNAVISWATGGMVDFYSDAFCSDMIFSTTISAETSTKKVFARFDNEGAVSISFFSSLPVTSLNVVVEDDGVIEEDPIKIGFKGNTQTDLLVGECISVTLQTLGDDPGEVLPVSETLAFTTDVGSLNAATYSDDGCTNEKSSFQIAKGNDSRKFYFKSMEKKTGFDLGASSSFLGDASITLNITEDLNDRIILSGPSVLKSDVCSGPIEILLLDENSNNIFVEEEHQIGLSATEGEAHFYKDSACATEVASVSIAKNDSSKVFYVMPKPQAEELTVQAEVKTPEGSSIQPGYSTMELQHFPVVLKNSEHMRGRDLAVNSNGGIISVGAYSSNISSYDSTGWSRKILNKGTIQGAHSTEFGNIDGTNAEAVAVDSSDNYIIGQTHLVAGKWTGYIKKTTNSGDDVFFTSLPENVSQVITGVAAHGNNTYVSAFRGASAELIGDKGVNATNCAVYKLDSDGNVIWERVIGGNNGVNDPCYKVRVSSNGTVYVAGHTGKAESIHSGMTNFGKAGEKKGAFVLYLNPDNGSVIGGAYHGGSNNGIDLALGKNGGIYLLTLQGNCLSRLTEEKAVFTHHWTDCRGQNAKGIAVDPNDENERVFWLLQENVDLSNYFRVIRLKKDGTQLYSKKHEALVSLRGLIARGSYVYASGGFKGEFFGKSSSNPELVRGIIIKMDKENGELVFE